MILGEEGGGGLWFYYFFWSSKKLCVLRNLTCNNNGRADRDHPTGGGGAV